MITVINKIEKSLVPSLQKHLNSKKNGIGDLLLELANISSKNIISKPRQVYFSKEIKKNYIYLNEKKTIIQKIIKDIRSGNDLSKYLSTKIKELNYTDKTLASFGISHFHLGEKIETKGSRQGKIKGTDCLLFIYFDFGNAYLLEILKHKDGFLNIKLLEILQRNWPNLLESLKVKGISSPKKPSDKEVAELLKKNINPPILINEDVYVLPTGGLTGAGISLKNVYEVMKARDHIQRMAILIDGNKTLVADAIRKITGTKFNTIKLRGRIIDNSIDIFDYQSMYSFFLSEKNIIDIKYIGNEIKKN